MKKELIYSSTITLIIFLPINIILYIYKSDIFKFSLMKQIIKMFYLPVQYISLLFIALFSDNIHQPSIISIILVYILQFIYILSIWVLIYH